MKAVAYPSSKKTVLTLGIYQQSVLVFLSKAFNNSQLSRGKKYRLPHRPSVNNTFLEDCFHQSTISISVNVNTGEHERPPLATKPHKKKKSISQLKQ